MQYRADGAGCLQNGYTRIFLVPAGGGTPRQLTDGPYNHRGRVSWSPDGKYLYFSANRHEAGEYEPRNTEVYRLTIADGTVTALTGRKGPDNGPVVSPDGKKTAYTGFDDRYQGYQITRLYIMDADGSNPRLISGNFDRDAGNIRWNAKGKGLFFQYDDRGNTKVAHISLSGKVRDLAGDVGGLTLGRPYSAGTYSMAQNSRIAYTYSTTTHPTDLAAVNDKREFHRLTALNDDLFVTGGSGGGILTAWIVGHTGRFRAAVSVKPVINWYSFILYAHLPVFFYKYWQPGLPWNHLEHYMKRSPIQYAGNVTTPTMLMTGESDFRTPIPEAEQFYMALKLQKKETALVRIPGASHGIAARPSNLIAKVTYVLKWFE